MNAAESKRNTLTIALIILALMALSTISARAQILSTIDDQDNFTAFAGIISTKATKTGPAGGLAIGVGGALEFSVALVKLDETDTRLLVSVEAFVFDWSFGGIAASGGFSENLKDDNAFKNFYTRGYVYLKSITHKDIVVPLFGYSYARNHKTTSNDHSLLFGLQVKIPYGKKISLYLNLEATASLSQDKQSIQALAGFLIPIGSR